jgi:hypothetical protein
MQFYTLRFSGAEGWGAADLRFPSNDEAVEFAERHAGGERVQVWLGGMLIKLVGDQQEEQRGAGPQALASRG